jgi:hypothetical protein
MLVEKDISGMMPKAINNCNSDDYINKGISINL